MCGFLTKNLFRKTKKEDRHMKMRGRIYKCDEVNELGYIEGYDELYYLFHYQEVEGEIAVGKIVEFDFLPFGENDMPVAVDVKVI